MTKKESEQRSLIVETIMKLDSKIDGLDARLDSMDRTLVKQELNLADHMRRTELAEKSLDALRVKLEPVEKHVALFEGFLKAFGLVATLVSLTAGVIKIVSFFS